MTKEKK